MSGLEAIIKISPEKILVGKKLSMSMAQNRTPELWQSFMPLRNSILHTTGTELYSLAVYPPLYFDHFDINREFVKWAASEVNQMSSLAGELDSIIIQQGLYAVFNYKGPGSDTGIFQYIFGNWLPSSAFVLDDRPHFEILGEKYKNNHPDSEEEIWIPVKHR